MFSFLYSKSQGSIFTFWSWNHICFYGKRYKVKRWCIDFSFLLMVFPFWSNESVTRTGKSGTSLISLTEACISVSFGIEDRYHIINLNYAGYVRICYYKVHHIHQWPKMLECVVTRKLKNDTKSKMVVTLWDMLMWEGLQFINSNVVPFPSEFIMSQIYIQYHCYIIVRLSYITWYNYLCFLLYSLC